jgi:hypothetical protein
MFKADPKKQVVLKFQELFGRDVKPLVSGGRLTPDECRRAGLRCLTRDGLYLTEVSVEGETVASATHSEWRKSYKLLLLELEKAYTEGTSMA